MFNDLDFDINELLPEILGELGGIGKVEIITETSGGYNTDPTSSTETFDNIKITPPTDFTKTILENEFITTTGLECYVLASEVTSKPIANRSYLTVYEGNFVDDTYVNSRLKIVNVESVMTGKVVNMYRLECTK